MALLHTLTRKCGVATQELGSPKCTNGIPHEDKRDPHVQRKILKLWTLFQHFSNKPVITEENPDKEVDVRNTAPVIWSSAAGPVPLINIQMNYIQRCGKGRGQRRDGCRYRTDCQVSTFGPFASRHGAP